MTKFHNIKIGDFAEIKHLISKNDIEKFISLTGDDNKIHTNNEFASRTSFKKPVAHGMLSASFISTIIGTKIPGDGALWISQTLDFHNPVRVDDTIYIKTVVINKDERSKIIELETEIVNQDKIKVITGKSKVKIIEEAQEIKIETTSIKKDVALIIGASGGIGYSCALALANAGYDIAIHYNKNKSNAEILQKEISKIGKNSCLIQFDFTNNNNIEEIIKSTERKLGSINLLLNCATLPLPNIKFENLDWADIQKQMDANIKLNFFLAQSILPKMKEKKLGKIIFISTQYTENTPPNELLHYVTAKSALNGFAKALAVEAAPYNIEVNVVSPGMTDTDLIANIPEKTRLIAAAKTPLRKIATPKDIANAVEFLANKATHITGETIRVNGGSSMI